MKTAEKALIAYANPGKDLVVDALTKFDEGRIRFHVGDTLEAVISPKLASRGVQALADEDAGLFPSRIFNLTTEGGFSYTGPIAFVGIKRTDDGDTWVGLTHEQIEFVREWLRTVRS